MKQRIIQLRLLTVIQLKRFNFKLEKILKLRLNREQETKLELGKAIGILSALELRIKRVAEEKAAAMKNRFSAQHGFNEIRSYEFYILRLDKTKDALLEAAAKAELEVEKAREIFLEASRDRKVISNLKERQEKEYRRAMNLEEIKEIDDLSDKRYARNATAMNSAAAKYSTENDKEENAADEVVGL